MRYVYALFIIVAHVSFPKIGKTSKLALFFLHISGYNPKGVACIRHGPLSEPTARWPQLCLLVYTPHDIHKHPNPIVTLVIDWNK